MSGADRIRVRVVNLTRVSPDPPPPLPAAPLRLSFFDALWIGIPPVRRLLLYLPAPPLPVLLPRLQSSLSRALALFFPLAGTLAASRDLAIACSPRDGVRFVEADADGDLGRLIDDDVHDRAAFRLLVPDLEAGAMAAVQATGFAGGVAIGVAFSHVVADGRAIWDFLRAWAGMCGAAGEGAEVEKVAVSHERSAIVHPFGDRITRQFLEELAPDFPKMRQPSSSDADMLVRRTFTLSSTEVQLLKDQALACDGSAMVPVSTFVAVSAHVWVRTTQVKRLSTNEEMFLVFLADCRSRLSPPVDEHYFGNCVNISIVKAMTEVLIREDGFMFACHAIQKVVQEVLDKPLKDCENWVKVFSDVPMNRLVNVAASPRFRVYDTDFGWGRPCRVELLSMNHDGAVVLVGAKDEGAVQVSMTLPPLQMEEFTSLFHCLCTT